MCNLIRNNVLAFIKKEPVYFFTMTLIASIMFAFNSMLFSPDIKELCEQSYAMDILLLVSSGIIVFVNAWLVHYIMEYILKQRGREFAIYMSVGIKKKEIFWLYCKETCCQACFSWITGLFAGCLLQQFLMDIFYHLFRIEYKIKINISLRCILLSYIFYIICYIAALVSIRRYFMKLDIAGLLIADRKTEQTVINKNLSLTNKKLGTLLLKNNRLFLYRTVTSKMKTMKRVIFITTLLLACSLTGSTIAMFYTDYQNHQIDAEFPYSLLIYHDDGIPDFIKEKEVLKANRIKLETEHEYIIYKNSSEYRRIWLYTHLNYFNSLWEENSYNINQKVLDNNPDYDVYYQYDTFMKLSDYNKLRKMLGFPQKELGSDKYILQVKNRISKELSFGFTNKDIVIGNKTLYPYEICTDEFEQNGHNGADYIIVIPDEAASSLKPYYSVYALQTSDIISSEVSSSLSEINTGTDNFKYGSNHNILYASPVLVKTEIEGSLKSLISVLLFPFAYISLVFLCATMAVLSIQLVSDSKIHKYRYMVLARLGMKESGINKLVHQQLALSYLVPAILALVTGGTISLYISRTMVYNVGMSVAYVKYLLLSLIWIAVIYLAYYILADLLFRRNIFFDK